MKDEFPENKKLKSWTIPQHKVIRFPRTNESWEQITVGDKVLSLWYMPDAAEWSSMFYEATIVNIEEGQAVRARLFLCPFFNAFSQITAGKGSLALQWR